MVYNSRHTCFLLSKYNKEYYRKILRKCESFQSNCWRAIKIAFIIGLFQTLRSCRVEFKWIELVLTVLVLQPGMTTFYSGCRLSEISYLGMSRDKLYVVILRWWCRHPEISRSQQVGWHFKSSVLLTTVIPLFPCLYIHTFIHGATDCSLNAGSVCFV